MFPFSVFPPYLEFIKLDPHVYLNGKPIMKFDLWSIWLDALEESEYEEYEGQISESIAIATLDDYDETERRYWEYVAERDRIDGCVYQIRKRRKAKYMSILRERLRERLRIKALKASIIQQQKEIEQRNKLIKKRYGIYK